ncbi:allophanate hydrolase subunit 2 family protein, partial [Acinetobacter baumannii]
MRSYVTVSGGIAVEPVLGSRSTDLKAGFGGLWGRALRDGDLLPVGEARRSPTRPSGLCLPEWSPVVRVLPGP